MDFYINNCIHQKRGKASNQSSKFPHLRFLKSGQHKKNSKQAEEKERHNKDERINQWQWTQKNNRENKWNKEPVLQTGQ